MRCYEHRDAEPIDVHEKLHDLPANERVEVSRRLICYEQFGLANNGTCDRGALLLAARELRWVAIGKACQANDTQRTFGGCSNALWLRPSYLKGEGDVLAHGSSW